MLGRISQALKKKNKKEEKGQELTIVLSHDAVQRLERLRSKFKRLDDSELIAFSLKSLEHRMNRIVKRLVLKKIRDLEKKGLLTQQIADHLNRQGIHGPGKEKKWNAGSIARFCDEHGGVMENKTTNQQGGYEDVSD